MRFLVVVISLVLISRVLQVRLPESMEVGDWRMTVVSEADGTQAEIPIVIRVMKRWEKHCRLLFSARRWLHGSCLVRVTSWIIPCAQKNKDDPRNIWLPPKNDPRRITRTKHEAKPWIRHFEVWFPQSINRANERNRPQVRNLKPHELLPPSGYSLYNFGSSFRKFVSLGMSL